MGLRKLMLITLDIRVVLNLRNFESSNPQEPSYPSLQGSSQNGFNHAAGFQNHRASQRMSVEPYSHARNNRHGIIPGGGRDFYVPRTSSPMVIHKATEISTYRDEETVIPMVDMRPYHGP
jgi:hypothetical protein